MAGKLFIVSAPSGSGKTTLIHHLLQRYDDLAFSISATTRNRRGEEIHGKDYYFLSKRDFEEKIQNDEFAEFEEVYEGIYYGTLKSEIERIWAEGKNVVFDVDVIGGLNLKKYYQEKAFALYVKVSNFDELVNRLKTRGTDSSESLKQRIDKMREEISYQNQFDQILLNDDLRKAEEEIEIIYQNFLKN